MFCSNCGRSVTINDVTCPHCKVRLGDMLSGERFPGNVFTSTQLKLVPEKKGDLSGIVSTENMGTPQPGDNVYSGTAYRAAFTEPAEDGQDTVWMSRGGEQANKEEEQQEEDIWEEETDAEEETAEAETDIEPAEDTAEEITEEASEEETEETEESEETEETEESEETEEDIPQDIPVYEDEQTEDEEEEVEVDEDEERVFDDEEEDEDVEEDDASDDDEIDPFEEDRAPVTHTKKQISPEFRKTMAEMEANMAVERKPRSMLWGTLPFGKNRAEAPAEPKHAKKDAPIEEAAEPEENEEIFEEVSEDAIEEVAEEVTETADEEAVEVEEEDIEEADIAEYAEAEDVESEEAEADAAPVKKFLSFFKKKETADETAEQKNDVTVDDDLFDAEEELTEEEETAAEAESEEDEEAPELEELKDEETDENGEKKGFDLKAFAAKIGSNNIVRYIIYAAVGVLIILGIVSWLKNVSAQSSNIAGVTHSVYNDAIAKMTAFVQQENVDMLTQTASANESYAKELMEEDREAITGLLPDAPMESDEVFLAAVANIHKAAEDVIGKDGAAIYEGKTEERKAASEQEWNIINEAVASLKEANTATQVTSISVNLQNMIMPAPTATPEPVVKTVTYSTLREGMSDNDDVAKLQARLIKLGYLDGEADGDFGPKTTNAIKSFQNAIGMTADGVAGAELQEKLYAEDAPKAGK